MSKKGERGRSYYPLDNGDEDEYTANGSVSLPHLRVQEKEFFEIVSSGNVREARNFLYDHPDFNINCTSFQGSTPLHAAVQARSEAMVQLLLSRKDLDVGDCAMRAIRDNQLHCAEMILDCMRAKGPPEMEFEGCFGSAEFPDHVTPLIVAAHCGHYEIIEMLLARGHVLPKPHKPNCICHTCRMHLQSDDLLHAETYRLSLYKAECNPAYICQSSDDPVLRAFQLARELRECADLRPQFRQGYLQLAAQASEFAVDLIDCCRSTEEMLLLLRQRKGEEPYHTSNFPRLALAIEYKEKGFVAHPNTQQIVENAWVGDWYSWRLGSWSRTIAIVGSRFFLLPCMLIMAVLAPKHRLVERWNNPINKLISHLSSYFVFLGLLFLLSNTEKRKLRRGAPNTGLEPFILVYTLGYLWNTLRLCAVQGARSYFKRMWHWCDLSALLLLCTTFVLWGMAEVNVVANGGRNLPRKYWHYLDPTLLAEGTFAAATILAFMRILSLLQLNYHFGPLQICMSKMFADVFKFAAIYSIIFLSFVAGLSKYYEYYKDMVQVDYKNGLKVVQESSFVSFIYTLKTLFWALFCMSPTSSATVVIENVVVSGEEQGPKQTAINYHHFTQAVGFMAFAAFEILCIIVTLNMLIAAMADRYQRVTSNAPIEWTFSKTQVLLEYMGQTMLPSPFNLMPTWRGYSQAATWLCSFLGCGGGKKKGKRARCCWTHCCYMEETDDNEGSIAYKTLISQLVQRYLRRKGNSSNPQEVELELLKEDLGDIKELLLDLARK